MKNIFLLLSSIFVLQSCITYEIQREVYYIEKYPVEWQDTIYFKAEHFHYQDNSEWRCAWSDADTFCLSFKDTIQVPRLVKVETIRSRK